MKRRLLLGAGLMLSLAMLGGCAVRAMPAYSTVRVETNEAMQAIVDKLPPGASVSPRPDGAAYSCDDSVAPGDSDGYVYTGQWEVVLPAGFDVPAFIDSLPRHLGEGWATSNDDLQLSFATVDVTRKSTGVGVSVSDVTRRGAPAIDLLATSRCGSLASPHA